MRKKNKNVRFENFFLSMLPVRCEKRIVLSTIRATIRYLIHLICTKKYIPNFHKNYEKIQKRFNAEFWNDWKIKNISHLYASPLLFHQYHTSTSERGRRGRESKATWSARGNRNNSMTEGDAGNQTRSSSPSFNEFHALLCPYNFAQARVHAYPTRSSR